MQGRKEYQEKLFIQFQLSDQIPADNLYRRINETIDFNFLYKLTAKYYGREGQKSIDPVVFMKLMLSGYLENLNSDRRIINSLRLRLDIRYFIGYNLDEELPWHSTLSRTRQLYGEHVFMDLFKKVLEQCIEKGMISGRRQAVDGVYIKANASMDSMVRKGIMADAVVYGQELEANEGEEQISQATDDTPTIVKEQPVATAKGLSVAHKNTGTVEREKTKASTHYSPVDRDARLSVKRGKVMALNYLGQICVDTASHMITYVQAFHADKRDSQCLPAVAANMVGNLKENGIIVQELLADSGFSSGTALKVVEAMDITAYIPNLAGYKSQRENFIYHPEGDYYECRNGKELTLQGIYDGDKRYTRTQLQCNGCPFKDVCIGDKREVALTESIYKPYYDRMHVRMQTKQARRAMSTRQSTVEPVIGTLVNYHAMKKVNSRGIAQANKCLTMAAIAYNIKKLLKHRPRYSQSQYGELRNSLNKASRHVLTLLYALLLNIRLRFDQIQLGAIPYE